MKIDGFLFVTFHLSMVISYDSNGPTWILRDAYGESDIIKGYAKRWPNGYFIIRGE